MSTYDKEKTAQAPASEASPDKGTQNEPERQHYHDAEVDERIRRAVMVMGFETMTPIQEQAIPHLTAGRDIIGQAQTGTGKTAAFGIPMIQMIDPNDSRLQAMVLCPTRELAVQVSEEIRKLAKYMHQIKVLPVYGGQEIYRQIKALSAGVQIVVGTPGRVMDHMRRRTIRTGAVKMIVLDEADEMLNMGFREDIETILKDIPEKRQMALFSATMPQPILDIAHAYQNEPQFIRVTPKEVTIDLVKQAYYRVQRKDKMEVIARLIDYYQPGRALIFCNTKRMVDSLSEELKVRGFMAEALHGDLTQNMRDNVLAMFKKGKCQFLIATDVAARGLDISGVDAVFNYDVPEDIEYYVHRIGRTGRAGRSGRSFTLVSGREIYKIRDIERAFHTTIKERNIPKAADITRAKLDKIILEAKAVMDKQDLDETIARISKAMEQYDLTAIELAAAFMKEKLGDELAEIREEKPFFKNERAKGQHKGQYNRKDQHGGKGQYGSSGGRSGGGYSGGNRSGGGKKPYESNRPYRSERKNDGQHPYSTRKKPKY